MGQRRDDPVGARSGKGRGAAEAPLDCRWHRCRGFGWSFDAGDTARCPAAAADTRIARGKYLVGIAGCNDCHTPGYFFGKPDMARFLSGSEVGFEMPGLGVFYGPNLTPDRETGLGTWSPAQMATAITKGIRPDGRILAPIMPWHAFASLTPGDVRAIVAYLQSLPPVKSKVPGPFGPDEKATSFVMKIVPPQAAAPRGPRRRSSNPAHQPLQPNPPLAGRAPAHHVEQVMETRITEIADRIYRLSTFVPDIAPPAGFTFNQFLIAGRRAADVPYRACARCSRSTATP